jgi:hypothetical protein
VSAALVDSVRHLPDRLVVGRCLVDRERLRLGRLDEVERLVDEGVRLLVGREDRGVLARAVLAEPTDAVEAEDPGRSWAGTSRSRLDAWTASEAMNSSKLPWLQ